MLGIFFPGGFTWVFLTVTRVLKPGGWLQFVELYYIVQSDNGTITEKHAIRQLTELYSDAVENTKDLRAPLKMEALMKDAGLVELATRIVQLPLNSWSNSRSLFTTTPVCVLSTSP